MLFLICKFNATNKLYHIESDTRSYIKFIEFCHVASHEQSNLEITNTNLVQDKKGLALRWLDTISGQNHLLKM